MGITLGTAVYKADNDVWSVSYYGPLYEDFANTCTVVFVENFVSSDNSVITLSENSIIYEDQEGSYLYSGGDLVVSANLKPKTGRMRLKGTEGQHAKVYGITHFTTFDNNTNRYSVTSDVVNTVVNQDGYTPYLYGYFTETEEPCIKLWVDAKEAYTRYLSADLFTAGTSGKLTIPTEKEHSGWSDGLVFTIKNIRYKMIAVEGGTFTMGVKGSEDSYYLPHTVTLTGFCIGETEFTNQFYGALVNSGSYNDNKPFALGTSGTPSVSDWTAIFDKLSEKTNCKFSLPTEAQWEFAAIGGLKTKGYYYSGSNNFDDVGASLVTGNTSYANVKSKLPNELGLYDMSGNAIEIVWDKYAPYSTASQVNPNNQSSGSYRCLRAGVGDYGVRTREYRNANSYYAVYVSTRPVINWD
jgi:formylglycine-generating enzyme required for sulfatase activity